MEHEIVVDDIRISGQVGLRAAELQLRAAKPVQITNLPADVLIHVVTEDDSKCALGREACLGGAVRVRDGWIDIPSVPAGPTHLPTLGQAGYGSRNHQEDLAQ